MSSAKVTFLQVLQDSQELGSNDEHMVSRVSFSVEVDGKVQKKLHVDIKQSVGADFESAPLEVGPVLGVAQRLDYTAFREAVERYYRSMVGSQGSMIRVEGRGQVRMYDNLFVRHEVVEIPIGQEGGW